MAKVLSAYTGFTAAQIAARATCPDSGDMSVDSPSSGYVSCSAITTTKIRNAIGAGVNSIGALDQHANVNQWSKFSPWKHTLTGSGLSAYIYQDRTTPYDAGDFAGYNHTAIAPGFIAGGLDEAQAAKWYNPGATTFMLHAHINLGELDYGATATSINMVIRNPSGNIIHVSPFRAITDAINTDIVLNSGSFTHAGNGTYYCSIHVTTLTLELPGDILSTIGNYCICKVPNTTFEFILGVNTATDVTFYNTGPGNNFVVEANHEVMTLSTGVCGFVDAVSTSSFDELSIIGQLFDQGGTQIGSDVSFKNPLLPYIANDLMTDQAAVGGMTNVPSYGYHWKITFGPRTIAQQ